MAGYQPAKPARQKSTEPTPGNSALSDTSKYQSCLGERVTGLETAQSSTAVPGAGVERVAAGPAVGAAGGRVAARPPASGCGEIRCWTLGRVKALIGWLGHISCALADMGKPLDLHGWSVPSRRGASWSGRRGHHHLERAGEVRPGMKAPRRTRAPTCVRARGRARAEAAEGTPLGAGRGQAGGDSTWQGLVKGRNGRSRGLPRPRATAPALPAPGPPRARERAPSRRLGRTTGTLSWPSASTPTRRWSGAGTT